MRLMVGVLFVVCGLACTSVGSDVVDATDTTSLLRDFAARAKKSQTDWDKWNATEALRKVVSHGAKPAHVAIRLADKLSIPRAAAEHFLRAILLEDRLRSSDGGACRRQPPAIVRLDEIEAELRLALAAAPQSSPVIQAVARHFEEWQSALPDSIERLRSCLHAKTPKARLALSFSSFYSWNTVALEAVRLALSDEPENIALWSRLPGPLAYSPVGIAASERAARLALARARTLDDRVVAAVASAWIAELLQAGLARESVAAFSGLPSAVQARLVRGRPQRVKSIVDDLPFEGRIEDLRLSLAAAHVLIGDRAGTRRMVSDLPRFRRVGRLLPPTVADGSSRCKASDKCGEALLTEMLARTLEGSNVDAFDLIANSIDAEWPQHVVGQALLAVYAMQSGYNDAARYSRQTVIPWLERVARIDDKEAAILAGGWPEAIEHARAYSEAAQISIAEMDRLCGIVSSTEKEAPLADLDSPSTWPNPHAFTERRLPEGVEPVEASEEEIVKMLEEVGKSLHWPEGFDVIRFETHGPETIAIGLSQNYDPMGEVSPGGYWILRTRDGGQTFDASLYTGLRAYDPYLVRPLSRLPMVQADRLTLEVDVREIDPQTITFPPVGMGLKRRETGLVLELPFADLERDTDGDRLTDLAEEALFTDPERSDTDGDGLSDGEDSLPNVARRPGEDDRRTAALRKAVSMFTMRHGNTIVEAPEASPGTAGRWSAASFSDERTAFVIGHRADFERLDPDGRMIVIEPDEYRKLERRRLAFMPFQIELLLFDRDLKRCLIKWNAVWRGGTLRYEWRDGDWWPYGPMSSWIT